MISDFPLETLNKFSEIVRPASVFDPFSARMAEHLGFECLMLAGSIAAQAHLGMADDIRLTSTELADLVTRICARARLPLLVDADHGYGAPHNTARTVALLARAGAAAATIEDTMLPAPPGAKSSLVPIHEGRSRISAALEAGRTHGLTVIGRTSAASISGVQDAMVRLSAYSELGCPVLMPVGRVPLDALRQLYRDTGKPLMLSALPPEEPDDTTLHAAGVRILLTGHSPSQAAARATFDDYSRQRQKAYPFTDELRAALLS